MPPIPLAAALLLLSLSLSGCASFGRFFEDSTNLNGSISTVTADQALRLVDLPNAIASTSTLGASGFDKTTCVPADSKAAVAGLSDTTARQCLESATAAFYADPADLERRRDAIQARLMAASTASCTVFLQNLNAIQSNGNFIAGTGATIAGALGAITTHPGVARSMAGLAAGLTGIRAEFNSDYFYRQTAPVIAKSIKTARDKFDMATIQVNRAKSIRDYPLWSAIGDGLRYNDLCSLESGLETLGTALDQLESPGLDAVNRTLLKTQQSRQIMNGTITKVSQLITDASLTPSEIAASKPVTTTSTIPDTDIVATLAASVSAITAAKTRIDKAISTAAGLKANMTDATNAITNLKLALTDPALPQPECQTTAASQATSIARAAAAVAVNPKDGPSLNALSDAKLAANVTALKIKTYAQAVVNALNQASSTLETATANGQATASALQTAVKTAVDTIKTAPPPIAACALSI